MYTIDFDPKLEKTLKHSLMSEQELNSYRFLSGEDPSDEMLECIMKDALESAINRKREAEARLKAEVERHRQLHRAKWAKRLNSQRNVEEVPEWARNILPDKY